MARHGDFTALQEHVVDHVDDAVRAQDVRPDDASADIFPFGKVFCETKSSKSLNTTPKMNSTEIK